MATTNILAAGTTAANSTDVTVASGGSANLFLMDAAGPGVGSKVLLDVQIKSSNNAYFTVGRLTAASPMFALRAPGTYRVTRPANSPSVGVDAAS